MASVTDQVRGNRILAWPSRRILSDPCDRAFDRGQVQAQHQLRSTEKVTRKTDYLVSCRRGFIVYVGAVTVRPVIKDYAVICFVRFPSGCDVVKV